MFFSDDLKSQRSQGDLVFVLNEASTAGLCMQDFKCLCAAVTICANLVDPKFDFYMLTRMTSKGRSNKG